MNSSLKYTLVLNHQHAPADVFPTREAALEAAFGTLRTGVVRRIDLHRQDERGTTLGTELLVDLDAEPTEETVATSNAASSTVAPWGNDDLLRVLVSINVQSDLDVTPPDREALRGWVEGALDEVAGMADLPMTLGNIRAELC